ncbi:beta-1,3-galactosyltransferase 1-like [Stigmatopora nigra]
MSPGTLLGRLSACTSTCRHLFFLLALLTALLFFHNNITIDSHYWKPGWWKQDDAKKISSEPTMDTKTEVNPYFVAYPAEYHFIINEPQKCKDDQPFLVLMVPVAPSNRRHRDIIRKTWGGQREVLGKCITVFFLLGQHTGEPVEQLDQQLQQESKEHQDLIQSNFMDSYNNLTIKSMVMLEWLDSYCSDSSYAMKIDSDVYLNLKNLITMLLNAPQTNYMTGYLAIGAEVCRDSTSKWYLPTHVYPQPLYPSYVLGLGYVLSLDLPKKLVEASRHVKAIYIEDVYLALCAQYMGIHPTQPPDLNYFHFDPLPYNRCAYSKLVATTLDEHTDLEGIWKDLESREGELC